VLCVAVLDTILDILLLLICNSDGSVSIAYGSAFDIFICAILEDGLCRSKHVVV
jgi:hypothetical protein